MNPVFVLAFSFAFAAPLFASPESWADGELPVQTGLTLWLDASRINLARAARQLSQFASGAAVDYWPDASGLHADLSQASDEKRPIYQTTSAGSFLHFDGVDDFLGAGNLGSTMSGATLFVVTAPRSNAGSFRAVVSANATGLNDYTSGFNVDFGSDATRNFETLNVEGAGFSGQRDLLASSAAFGRFHVLAIQLQPGASGVRLFLDGTAENARDRADRAMRIDQFTVGARFCSNESKSPFAQGFFDGDIAELLLFDRALDGDERNRMTKYLFAKYAALRGKDEANVPGKPLVPAVNPPLVQMLVPGFSVQELPLELTNIDCLRYRADGRLVAGAYNGKIWILTDTNSDGLEDKAQLYWQSADVKNVIGMALTPPGDPRGNGVFIATAGRILFIPDKDGDGRGDEAIVVATDWERQAAPGGGGSVDALGLALGPDGSLYFGLGTSAYNNAYLLDKEGRPHYELRSERGTILRVAPDFSKREIVCTGIRYPYGAAFNRFGDLFVTEQEGATWLPNGNPFDELLHIQKGRHYGFPPRHPRHLPAVIDEPSTFDYRPQHQSTCGLVFNEPLHGNHAFGPSSWIGDVFVAGESRGKLWRTKLAKTAAGYVAQTNLIACLGMLTVDVAISPQGDLVVACHSGKPDWGTGPEGAGKLFKIRYVANETPQPVLTWSSAPDEFRVAFDRELDPVALKNLRAQVDITRGRYVAAGDRFESIRPGYQVVKDQLATTRRDVPVLAASVTADRRTLVLATEPLQFASSYAITLPEVSKALHDNKETAREPRIDLATDLCGVEARWQAADGSATVTTCLPHLDLQLARAFTTGSNEHAVLWEKMKRPGSLTLRGQLDLWQLLHPAVQPGAQLDYEPGPEAVRVRISSDLPVAGLPLTIERESREKEWVDFNVELPTGAAQPELHITWTTTDDPRPRPFPLRRFLLPWARSTSESEQTENERGLPELAGGNWLRGRALYFGKATCHLCHAVQGEGGAIGPDLSNLIYRDLASVVRDIREPSAALNPDHLAYQVTLKNGPELLGVLLGNEREMLRLGDAGGTIKAIPRANVRALTPLTTSLMPPGLLDALNSAEQRDLLTFLLTAGLQPAPIEAPNAPPARSQAEVAKLLAQSADASSAGDRKVLRLLLVSGPKDHGPGEHDYPIWARRWSKLLALSENVQVASHEGWPTREQFSRADVIVFYWNNPGWNAARRPELDDFIERGGGAVFIHWAVEGREDAPALADCIGLASNTRTTKYRHGGLELTFPDPNHPITRGFKTTAFLDESYWDLVGDSRTVQILGEQVEAGAARPQLWTMERGAGRVFVSIPGHYTWTFDDPLFRILLLRGICWSAKQPVDRLSELATVGARVR